jgi:hypothetical protein
MGQAVTPLNTANSTKYFYPADGNWELRLLPMKASVAIAEGAAVQHETSGAAVTGYYTLCVAAGNIAGDDFYGIMAEPIAATDTDYATAGKLKGVYVPTTPFAKAYFYVGAGTFTAADVGATVALHSDYKSLAVDSMGLAATITDYISSTRGKCMFNMPNTQVA